MEVSASSPTSAPAMSGMRSAIISGVAAEPAARDDDGLAVELEVALVVRCHQARNGAVVHDDVARLGGEQELGTVLLGDFAVVAVDLCLVALGQNLMGPMLSSWCSVFGKKAVGHGGEVVVGELREVPVGGLGGILRELHDQFLVRVVARDGHPVLEELHRVDLGHAALLEDGGVQRRELVAHGVERVLRLLFHQIDLLAFLGQLAAGGDAGEAVPAHHDVAVDLLREVGDLRWRRAPPGLAGSARGRGRLCVPLPSSLAAGAQPASPAAPATAAVAPSPRKRAAR